MANQTADKLQEVATGIQIQNFVNKIDEEEAKRSKAEIKETKELVSALRDLQKKIGEINDDKDKSPVLKTLSAWFEDKVAPIKKLTSLQGITETLAAKAGPGLVGTLLGGAAEGMQVAKEEKQREKSFVTSILEGTEEGRAWKKDHGVEKATQMALEHFKEREELEKQVAAFDLQEKMIQGEHGVEGAGLDAETEALREEARKKLKANKERFVKKKSVESDETVQNTTKETQSSESIRKELMDGVREGLQQEYESLSPEDKAAIDKNPEERDLMIEAAMQEIAKLSEEQLAALVRIANALDVNDLEEKESALEEDKQQIDLEKKEEKNPTKSLLEKGLGLFQKEFKGLSSIFSKGLSFLGSGLTKLIGPLASMVPSLLSFLGPAAAVAAAGAAGFAAGKYVVNPILNKAAESITGVEGETVGTGIYTAVDNIAGSKIGNLLGFNSDSQKLKEAETQAMVDLGKKKLANGEKVSAEMAKTLKENGIEVMDDQINQKPTKQETRSEITEAVERTADSLDVKNKEKPASIVNAPTVVNNSSNTTNITHKPIRNEEPSYMSGLNRKLVF